MDPAHLVICLIGTPHAQYVAQPFRSSSVFPFRHIGQTVDFAPSTAPPTPLPPAFSVTTTNGGAPFSRHSPHGLSYNIDAWFLDIGIKYMAVTTPMHIPVGASPSIIVATHAIVTELTGLKVLTLCQIDAAPDRPSAAHARDREGNLRL